MSTQIKDPNILPVPPAPPANVPPTKAAQEAGAYWFIPDLSYVQRKLKPEAFSDDNLRALAQAQAVAVHNGVLDPKIAEYMLANALTERRNDFGALSLQEKGMALNPQHAATAAKMGLGPADTLVEPYKNTVGAGVAGPTQTYENPGLFTYSTRKNGEGISLVDKYEGQKQREMDARMAAFILSTKGKTPQEAYTNWNGKGKGVNMLGDNYDANNHWRKVEAQHKLLNSLPQNQRLYRRYKELLQQEQANLANNKKP